MFGLIYGLLNARLSAATQTGWGRQVGLGLLFGVALWLVNFQILARILYPWFLATPQFLQALLHALFFGLPLALMYAAAERRVHRMARIGASGAPPAARLGVADPAGWPRFTAG